MGDVAHSGSLAGDLIVRRGPAGLNELVRRPARRPEWIWHVAPFLIALGVYLAALLVMQPQATGDEPHYALEAVSLSSDFDRDLRNNYADASDVLRVFPVESLDSHAFRYPGSQGEEISIHNVGLPVLLAPIAAVGGDVFAMRLVPVLLSALAAYFLFQILFRLNVASAGWNCVAWGLVAFSLPLVVYSSGLYPEIPAMVILLGSGLMMLSKPAPNRLGYWVAALGIAYLPWLHVRFYPLALALAVGLGWGARRALLQARAGTVKASNFRFALAAPAVLLLLSGLAMAAAFTFWYGSPDPRAQYGVEPFISAVGLDAAFSYRGIVGGLLSPVYGWLPFAPVHVIGLCGIFLLVWRLKTPALAALAAAVVYWLIVGSSGVEPGYSFPTRFQLTIIPLVAVPLAVALSRSWSLRVLAAPLGALSLLVVLQGVLNHHKLYPNSGTPGIPQLPIVQRLRSAFPDFSISPALDPFPDVALSIVWILGICAVGALLLEWFFRERKGSVPGLDEGRRLGPD